MLLLDTNIVSELRKVKTNKVDENFTRWAECLDANNLYISAISIMELEMAYCRQLKESAEVA